MTRKRSNESVGRESLVNLTLPHTLDRLGSESAVRKNGSHETDHVAIVMTNEVKRLDDVTNFHSVFVFHKTIIAFSSKKAIVKTRIKSITYEHVLEHTFCLFESGVGEANFVSRRSALDFVHVIPCVPEHVVGTKLVSSTVDKVVKSH